MHFYLLKGTLLKDTESRTEEFSVFETFRHDNPLCARTQAFDRFQSYLDVLLQYKHQRFITHQDSIEILQSFMNNRDSSVSLSNNDMGLFLYMVKGDSQLMYKSDSTVDYSNKLMIHCFGNNYETMEEYVLNALIYEYKLFIESKLDIDYQSVKTVANRWGVCQCILPTPYYC